MRHLIPSFIRTQFKNKEHKGVFQAYTMFIDLSGFTPLTETLMQQGNVGAEQLSMSLNGIFSPMVAEVYRRGGFIPYYAGDAFTAIFPIKEEGVSLESFLSTSQNIKELFATVGKQKTLFGEFEIGIKIGLSYGTVEWGIVGDAYKSYYFRGEAVNNCAECQVRANDQEIVFDAALEAQIKKTDFTYKAFRDASFFLFKERNKIAVDITRNPSAQEDVDRSIAEQFLPKSVLDFNQVGEFRSVISLFISFANVGNYDSLNTFSSIVLNQINDFSGYFKEIDFGDKGGVMVAFLGAPISFENNVDRALEFVLALEQETAALRATTNLKYRIGITSGEAYAGVVGGAERSQYAIVGKEVNLAARLMIDANWGETLVDEDISKDRHFRFKHKGDLNYKGIKKSVPTYIFEGRSREELFFTGQMIARDKELQQLEVFASKLWEKDNRSSGIAYVYGEAGMGKSRLIYELMRTLKSKGVLKRVICQSDQILQKPFNPFVYFLKNYFQQSPENSTEKNKIIFEEIFNALLKKLENHKHLEAQNTRAELIRTQSILSALMGLYYKNALWDKLDAKGRYQNTLDAVSNLFVAESILQAMIIELEDGHWYDDSSKELLLVLLRKMQQFPFSLLITSRYSDEGAKPVLIPKEVIEKYQFPVLEIDLNILAPDALLQFAEAHLGGAITKEFHQLLIRTTTGNPFYAEQILEYFVESNLLKQKNNKWHIKDKNVKLSNSISAILMARIDRLSTLVKETVKAAAVIGREFEVSVLSEVMKVQEVFLAKNGNTTTVLREQIKTAERWQIWRAMNELRYIFKHALLREAVYDMQLHARLRELHRLIAEAIENIYTNNIAERYVDLAFHYENAEVQEKTAYYLKAAADHARDNYQNQQALGFYDKLLAMPISTQERIKVFLKKGSILELIGNWDSCEQIYAEALSMADSEDILLRARLHDNLGKLLMLKGQYEEALQYLEKAVNLFELLKDDFGISKSYGNLGNLFFRQAEYDDAKEYFTRSIELSRNQPYNTANAQIVSNLGLTYMNQGNHQEGIRCQEEQLVICEERDDKQAIAALHTNMGIVFFEKGDYDAALSHYQKGLALSQELGNKLLTSIAIGCIGSVYERKGKYQEAMEHFEKDLTLCQELGDKQGIAIVHGLLGDLYSLKGEFAAAKSNLKEQLMLCEELNYLKGTAKALNTLGDVYTFERKYSKAIDYYDRAIELTLKIDNKLVLGYSLVEKADVLLAIKEIEAAEKLYHEAIKVANPLGNPELIFETHRLQATILIAQTKNAEAMSVLQKLLSSAEDAEERAAIYYEMSKVDKQYQQSALALYKDLYKATPKYLYTERIKELEQ